MLRPGERLLAGQQAEEGGGLHRAGQGGLVDVAVQRNLGGAEGSAVEMGDEGIAFEDEAVLFRSQRPLLPPDAAGSSALWPPSPANRLPRHCIG